MLTEDGDPTRAPRARQTLLVDEGAGAPLAAAAGDVAAGGQGYSARTQVATIVSYHVMANAGLVRRLLIGEIAELDAPAEGLYTRVTPEFREWLDGARAGSPIIAAIPSSEPATRMVGPALWFRNDPEALISTAAAMAAMETADGVSLVAAVAMAGAIAACSHVMSGWDLILGVSEVAAAAISLYEPREHRYAAFDAARRLPDMLVALRPKIGADFYTIAGAAAQLGVPDGVIPAIASIVLAANPLKDPVKTIEDAANNGGVDAGALTGAMVGARVGLRRWPWRVPNETWFAEIGRRLVSRERELRDLPVPYAVEERMQSAVRMHPRDEIA
jgi:hypothetical protein